MATPTPATLRNAVRTAALLLAGGTQDFDPLLERVGDAQVVLIGEATHGTHEFYAMRAAITRRLIQEKGFTAVAVEADWPDAWRVVRYVRGQSRDASGRQALADFRRFPTWMWRNTEVLDFVEWLRRHNETTGRATKAGFYGLDLYSLDASTDAVVAYLRQVDPAAAQRAERRYACFGRFDQAPEMYGLSVVSGLSRSCEGPAAEQLRELEGRAAPAGPGAEALFSARQNTRVVVGAERYYRVAARDGDESWNVRTRTWSTHCAPSRGRAAGSLPRWSFGHTTRTWAMRVPPSWANAGRSPSGNSRASSSPERRCSWASARTRARSPRRTTGSGHPS